MTVHHKSSLWSVLAAVLTLFSTSSGASQIQIQVPIITMVANCLNSAIASNSIYKVYDSIQFVCSGSVAKTLYGYLDGKVQTGNVTDDPTKGRYFQRLFWGDFDAQTSDYTSYALTGCNYYYTDSSGRSTQEFRCFLMLTVGELMNQ